MSPFVRMALVAFSGVAVLLPRVSGEEVCRLCADQWMPFNGVPTDSRPGYVVEMARAILEPHGIKVEYEIQSWEDALVAVREGRMSGAIGVNTSEGEGMVIPAEPIGAPAVCVVVRADSSWTYNNVMSFRDVKLGVIKDYSYWPGLDDYIARKTGSGVEVVEGEDPLGDLMGLLTGRKVEVIAESEPTLLWNFRENNLSRDDFRVVYKHNTESIYVGFAPTDDGRRFAGLFDEGIRTMRASGALATLLKRYGMRDWK